MKKAINFIKKAWYYAWHRHHLLIPFPALVRYCKSFFRNIKKSGGVTNNIFESSTDYKKWLASHPLKNIKVDKNNVTFLYTITTFNEKELTNSLNSLLCNKIDAIILVCDNYYQDVKDLLNKIKPIKINIKIINNNKHNSMVSIYNECLKDIYTEYICFVNSNIVFNKEFFGYVNNTIINKPDIVYSDEDHIDGNFKLSKPIFKPDFALDSFLGYNYFGNAVIISNAIIKKAVKLNSNVENNCFYDFLLNCVNKSKKIIHIQEILYHDYTDFKNGFNSSIISNYLKTNKINAEVKVNPYNNGYVIKYNHDNPKVSIIIPFKDQYKLTKDCINGLLDNLDYKNYELILIDNASQDKELLNWLDQINDNKRVKVFHNPMPFNFSSLCNYGVSKSSGDYYLFLNNDTLVINNDFLDWMVGYAQKKEIGAVGLKLLYDDKKIQHMGVTFIEGGYPTHFGCTENDDKLGFFDMRIRPYIFSAVTGACLLVEKKKYKGIKGFDEKLAVSLNDMDLCLKLLNKGYYNVCLNNITMFHFESKSRGYDDTIENSNRSNMERIYMKNKWGNDFENDKYYSKYFF